MSGGPATRAQLKVMERKLYRFITPFMVLTIVLGLWMPYEYAWRVFGGAGWFHVKLTLVAALLVYRLYGGKLVKTFARDENRRSHSWYRWFNELPVLILLPIIILTIVKPF